MPYVTMPSGSATLHRLLILLIGVLTLTGAARAQKQYDRWYFGQNAAIDFSGQTPAPLEGSAINTIEGSATICDPNTGALLFYTDGMTIWDRRNRPMSNGTDLIGHMSSTQAALIVPVPCQPARYLVFTTDQEGYAGIPNRGVHYAEVDMSRNNGLGAVVRKNIELLSSASEKLTAVAHANGTDYWVIAHSLGGNTFYAWQVTTTGVIATPVKSTLGTRLPDPATRTYALGYMKASPNARKLAIAGLPQDQGFGILELFDFDQATGAVSRPITLLSGSEGAYGISFSPDSRKLWAITGDNFETESRLYQFDVTSSDDAAVRASKRSKLIDRLWGTGGMQIGPDGAIYIAHYGERTLAAITKPNETIDNCRVVNEAVSLGVGSSAIGMPNNIDALQPDPVLACSAPRAIFGVSRPVICAGAAIALTDSSTGSPTSWEWQLPGSEQLSSTERSPSGIVYPTEGTYTITLTVGRGTERHSSSLTIRVLPGATSSAALGGGAGASLGSVLSMPLLLSDPLDSVGITQLRFAMSYDSTLLRLRNGAGAMLQTLTKGGMLDGWTIDQVVDRAGIFSALLKAPAGAKLAGTGRLLDLQFTTFISMARGAGKPIAGISFTIDALDGSCSQIRTKAASVDLSICGLSYRMMEIGGGKYAILGNSPNPFNPSTEIRFSLGLDGPTRVEIFDASGMRVATLLDEPLGPGEYVVNWDASEYLSGLYYCRITSGAWSDIQRMLLVK